nr:hypothetical protein CFP56_22466 [Quercus suber]
MQAGGVNGTPEVGDLVLEETSGERKDAMDRLAELEQIGVIECLLQDGKRETREERRKGDVRGQRDVAIYIVSRSQEQRSDKQRKGSERDDRQADEARDIQTRKKAHPGQICRDHGGIEERHLLESQRGHEEDAAPQRATSQQTRDSRHHEPQHDRVVLEMSVINENGGGLQQHRRQCNRRLPLVHVLQPREPPDTDHDRRHVDQKFRDGDCGAHEHLQIRVVQAVGQVQREPLGLETVPDHAKNPAVIRRQRRVVEPPPPQVVEVPMRDGQVDRELHPVSLRLKVAVHRWFLVAGVTPERSGPSKQEDDHEDAGE